ncbi:MAG TPA: SH3 domain-containing protein [Trichocoleus sp.]|jgi:uncharacterized protein YgiM (DUF1202 family)
MTQKLIVLLLMLMSLNTERAFAQDDPDYQIEVENNTVCSFITENNVNVRQSPDINSTVVTQLNRGDVVRATSRTGDWVNIAAQDSGQPPTPYSPLQGYVSNQYINGCSEDQFELWRQ